VASFLGFAPVEDPKISVLVIWDEPDVGIRYGGVLAAPVFQAIVRDALRYMEVPPTAPLEQGEDGRSAELVAVPDLIGRSSEDAAKALVTEFGLEVRVKGSGNVVRDQTPRPGARVARGTTVVLYLDMGELYNVEEENVLVPDLTGKTMKDAALLLTKAGLRMQAEGTGVARFSNPKPGTAVPRGSVVVVGFEPPGPQAPGAP
ncbi:MAG: PASTA domain-containing protein, partial [Bacillota bacterium]